MQPNNVDWDIRCLHNKVYYVKIPWPIRNIFQFELIEQKLFLESGSLVEARKTAARQRHK
jgi:hypothetical protein